MGELEQLLCVPGLAEDSLRIVLESFHEIVALREAAGLSGVVVFFFVGCANRVGQMQAKMLQGAPLAKSLLGGLTTSLAPVEGLNVGDGCGPAKLAGVWEGEGSLEGGKPQCGCVPGGFLLLNSYELFVVVRDSFGPGEIPVEDDRTVVGSVVPAVLNHEVAGLKDGERALRQAPPEENVDE